MPCPKTPEKSACRSPGLRLGAQSGQGTLEYAVVFAAMLSLIVGLGAMMHGFERGMFGRHAVESASHHIQASLGWFCDVFSY